ncbi:NFX1-type zinc finger-containing protein 1-like [Saccostrea echinata]|uniref:NFX1-type zinc finger-containing protein 1-like n=1 Tax=Saccostrea echinata TaxID=191078 RepID=UPI002A81EC39|nr:NFX1-type zinc finger-containing protein 1-like [Saccostrea echinata]
MSDHLSGEILLQKSGDSTSPEECLKYIVSALRPLENYFQRNISPICSSEDVCIMKIIFKSLKSLSNRELIVELLNLFRENHSVDYLIRLLSTLESDVTTEDSEVIITTVVEILKQLQSCMPSSSLQLQGLICVLENTIEKTKACKTLKRRISTIKEAISRSIEIQKKKVTAKENIDRRQPPGDFRNIPIFPRREDIYPSQRPFLRKVIRDGRYDDLEHYLDVQFRLFREDCISQLRDGIQEYRQEYSSGNHFIHRLENARIYNDVRILFRETSLDGILHALQLDEETYENIDWDNTKRLIHGSLVCLSCDNFDTFALATILVADTNVLSVRGIFKVKIIQESNELKGDILGRLFQMIESTALFEAYRYGLEKLKTIRPGQLAFEKYIVNCETDIGRVGYMEKDVMYDFSSVINKSSVKIDSTGRGYYGSKRMTDPTSWPSAEELHMNPSQYEAFKSSLTKEFCIIQGPPGTGKSYLGLQIVKSLLANTTFWSKGRISPIILVCFTNHALDQFLENILNSIDKTSWDKIVRVGGRCKNKISEDISLRKRSKRTFKKRRLIDLNRLQSMISQYTDMERRLPFTIIDHITFKMHIALPSGQFSQKEDKSMFRWLNVDKRGILDSAHSENFCEGNNEIFHYLRLEKNLNKNIYEDVFYDLTSSDEESEVQDLRIRESPRINFGINILDTWRSFSTDHFVARDREFRDTLKRVIEFILRNMNSEDIIPTDEAVVFEKQNIWELPISIRWKLYRYWKNQFYQRLFIKIERYEAFKDDIIQGYKQEKFENEYTALRSASLIAMTTTGAAKYHRMLQLLQPRITIIDEAAEVLEAHILASLTSSCQHLILIGDHKQLEPKPAVYELAQKYHMSLSFFERMIRNGVPYHCLLKQHRMRPDISLLVKQIYPGLHDGENVEQYESISGIGKDVFFLSHSFEEHYQDEGRSYENVYEAEFTTRLCKYLLFQGYKSSQITILTPYSGQLRCLSKFVDSSIKDIRICIVDNYQGEENDIILLSLVRSNKMGKLGFLDKENRVCVALSRARKGLFVIGNFDMMSTKAKATKLWKIVLANLKVKGCFGAELPLFCQNHPERRIQARSASDFDSCPEGGCETKCDARLPCGHACRRYCHPDDQNHESSSCYGQCLSTCSAGHPCSQPCHFPNPCECKEMVYKEFECGHENMIECYLETNQKQCEKIVTKYFTYCEHSIEVPCHEAVDNYNCAKIVKRELFCGHTASVQCHIGLSRANCVERIEKTWSCGHSSMVKCAYFDGAECAENVLRKLKCGHENWMECRVNPKYFVCKQMVEKVFQKCGHKKLVPCHEDIVRKPCTEVVLLKRKCGHEDMSNCYNIETDRMKKCESLCGQLCKRDHTCRRLCHFPEDCECKQPVQKYITKCGHTATMDCFQDPDNFNCTELITKEVPICRHKVKVECFSTIENFKCHEKVRKFRESCGHGIITECYKDPEISSCNELISKRLNCGHDCDVVCGEEISDIQCMKKVTKYLSCEHEIEVFCHEKDLENFACLEKLEYVLECGHFYPLLCSEYQRAEMLENIECIETVQTKLTCGHICSHPCGLSQEEVKCESRCSVTLTCGHTCAGYCQDCQKSEFHERCPECCSKQLLCSHDCSSELCESCRVCHRECENYCDHAGCGKRCFEICDLCILPCSWKCPHHRCSLLCHEICDRPRCSFSCTKKLKCQHNCLGFCGEPCPPYCSQCDSQISEKSMGSLEVNSRLVYLPYCRHYFESNFLDNFIVQMRPNDSLMSLSCPTCGKQITWHPRYNKIIKLQRKRMNLAKAITVYMTEVKSCEFLPLFSPSFLKCQEFLEDCKRYLESVFENLHENKLTIFVNKTLDQIDTVSNATRPSFDQYKSIYDATYRVSQEWQKIIIEKDNSLPQSLEVTTDKSRDESKQLVGEFNICGDVGQMMGRTVSLPSIILMADPHAENWKICKEGHPYCCISNYGSCIICKQWEDNRYFKRLSEYLSSISTVDLIADCKMPIRKSKESTVGTEGKQTAGHKSEMDTEKTGARPKDTKSGATKSQGDKETETKAENSKSRKGEKSKEKPAPKWKKKPPKKWWEEKL